MVNGYDTAIYIYEMLKGNARTYMDDKVARQKKEVW